MIHLLTEDYTNKRSQHDVCIYNRVMLPVKSDASNMGINKVADYAYKNIHVDTYKIGLVRIYMVFREYKYKAHVLEN